MKRDVKMSEIISVPLSYLEYYHMECIQNPHYSTESNIAKQMDILALLKKKGGIDEDNEIAMNKSDLMFFKLIQ